MKTKKMDRIGLDSIEKQKQWLLLRVELSSCREGYI